MSLQGRSMTISTLTKIFLLGSLSISTAIMSNYTQATIPSDYSADFENAVVTNNFAFVIDGWRVYSNVFTPLSDLSGPDLEDENNPIKGYGSLAPNSSSPNSPDNFAALACGQSGLDQGDQYINIFGAYEDYENRNEADSEGVLLQDSEGNYIPNHNYINANFFRQYDITQDDIGKTFDFIFDAKRPAIPAGPETSSPCGAPLGDGIDRAVGVDYTNGAGELVPSGTASAWVKVIDPQDNYHTKLDVSISTTDISRDEWVEMKLRVTITEDHFNASGTAMIAQFGFAADERDYGNTGVYYDNIQIIEVQGEFIPVPFVALIGLGILLTGVSINLRSKVK